MLNFRPFRFSSARRSALRPFGLTLLLVVLGQMLGSWDGIDDWLYDINLRVRTHWTETPSQVLLVRISDSSWNLPYLRGLQQELRGLGAQSISVAPANGAQYQKLAEEMAQEGRDQADAFFIGLPTTRHTDDPLEVDFAVEPSSAVPANSTGALYLPDSDGGIYRRQRRTVRVGATELPTLEARVIPQTAGATEYFGVDFRGGHGSLPHVEAWQVERGMVISDLVQNRHVLIGPSIDPFYLGLSTPTTRGGARMAALEFHGHALNTLANGTEIVRAPFWSQLLALTILSAAATWTLRWLPLRMGVMVVALMGLLTSLLVGVVLMIGTRWLPLAPLWAACVIGTCLVVDQRFRVLHQTMARMNFELTNRARRRRQPSNLILSRDPWSILGQFVEQILPTRYIALFESRAFDMYLRNVYLGGCASQDIVERRRDSRRHPFITATHQGGAIRLPDDRPMFDAPPNQPQYLVPLVFRGNNLGFMAVTMSAVEDASQHLVTLDTIAREIARIISQWQVHAPSRRPTWNDWLGARSEEQSLVGLMHSTHLLEDRLLRLENIVDSATTCVAVFDGFGRLLTMNRKLVELLQQENMLREQKPLDILTSQLTGHSLSAVRHQLRTIIEEGASHTFFVEMAGSRTSWVLSIRSVMGLEIPSEWSKAHDDTHLPSSDALPFRSQAVVLEMVSRETVDILDWLTNSLDAELSGTP